jgi:Dimerisation domain
MLEVPMTAPDSSIELMRLINAYQVSQALHVAATLGVADQLKEGRKSFDDLAQACGAHPTSLYRLLRALAAVGVFHETGNKEFSLTPLGVCLTTDAPGSRRNYARCVAFEPRGKHQAAAISIGARTRRVFFAVIPSDGNACHQTLRHTRRVIQQLRS